MRIFRDLYMVVRFTRILNRRRRYSDLRAAGSKMRTA